jgi:phosphatidylserine decarboxylase
VSPHSRRWSIPFFAENYRVITQFNSDHFGPIAMAEIGAFTVGSIPQCYQPGARMARGDHKSHFELGGSTVVMLFEKGRIEFDADLLANSEKGVETFVRMGEHIGRTPSVVEVGDEE